MKTNISLAKKWIESAIADLKRMLKSLEFDDFANVAFRSQFAVEKLNKSLLVLLGIKIQKTHEPTKFLKDLLYDEDLGKFDEESSDLIKQIISKSLIFEEEGTKTRYGVYKEDDFLIAEDIYNTLDDIKPFILNLEKLIPTYIEVLENFFQISEASIMDLKFLKELKEEIAQWI
jgi:HEPN domain-containing protein